MPIEIVDERLAEVLLDRRRQREPLAQDLARRQRDHDFDCRDRSAVGAVGQRVDALCDPPATSPPGRLQAESAPTSPNRSVPLTIRGSQSAAASVPKASIGRKRQRLIVARGTAGTSGASSPSHQRQKAGRP